jgi:hypothetical protein
MAPPHHGATAARPPAGGGSNDEMILLNVAVPFFVDHQLRTAQHKKGPSQPVPIPRGQLSLDRTPVVEREDLTSTR